MSLREDSLKSASASEPLQVGEVKNMKIIAVDPQEERRIVRKLDYCLIPLMTIFYLLSFLVSLFVPPVVVLLLTSRSISLIYRTVRILVLLIT